LIALCNFIAFTDLMAFTAVHLLVGPRPVYLGVVLVVVLVAVIRTCPST
jgi:hypothetical protein